MSGSKLDSVNYTTARAKHLCEQSVDVKVLTTVERIRDSQLHISNVQLQKKKYTSINDKKNE